MKFVDAVQAIWRVNDLRRIAGAHVVDHRQLSNDELRTAIIKAKPQYLHEDTVRANLETALYKEPRNELRVLSRLILVDILNNISKDKLSHFFWSSILLVPLVWVLGSFLGCLAVVVIAGAKELVWDSYLKKGNAELLDFGFGVLPVLIYILL